MKKLPEPREQRLRGVKVHERPKSHTVFLSEARKILAQAGHAIHAAQRAARGELGQLAVGFVSSAVYDKIPAIFSLMRARYPDVSLDLQDLTSEEQVEAINAHRLDVGLVRPPLAATEALALRVIWREPLVVVLPQAHRLAGYPQIALPDLAGEPFLQIARHVGPGYHDQFIRVCAQAGFSPRVVQEARTTQTIVSLVAAGMGIALVPGSLQSFQRSGIAYRPLKPPVPTTDLAVAWRPEDDSPALHAFLKILGEVSGAPVLDS